MLGQDVDLVSFLPSNCFLYQGYGVNNSDLDVCVFLISMSTRNTALGYIFLYSYCLVKLSGDVKRNSFIFANSFEKHADFS